MAQAPRPETVSGPAIAAEAESWVGRINYTWGGNTLPNVDCSGAVTAWLKHFNIKVPIGRPVVMSYVTWPGAVTVSGLPEPGDLVIFAGVGASGHIGIAVSGTEMVSALNPSMGCARTPIQGYGPAGAPLSYRRVIAAGNVPPGSPGGCASAMAAMTGSAALMIGGYAWMRTRAKR